jgi:hypothetical protein
MMKTFSICVEGKLVVSGGIEIQAVNEEEARKKCENMFGNKELIDEMCDVGDTIHNWNIWDVEEVA